MPLTPQGVRSGWGVFGPSDNLGMINLLTPARVQRASTLVRHGRMFPMDAPTDQFKIPLAAHRTQPRHRLIRPGNPLFYDDVVDNYHPQGSSQWDSLAHCAYQPGEFFNGVTEPQIAEEHRNTIDHWARHGIAGRAVLLDLPRMQAALGRPYEPNVRVPIDAADLEAVCEFSGVTLEVGDIILLRTGFLQWYRARTDPERRALTGAYAHPGLAQTEEVCEYLWDHGIVGIATDTTATEAWPAQQAPDQHPMAFLHRVLIGQFGMAIGELWQLDDLADDCAADGVAEVFLVSSPMNLPGGIGSPPNAIAFK